MGRAMRSPRNMRPIVIVLKNPINPAVTRAGVHAPVNLSIPAFPLGTDTSPKLESYVGRVSSAKRRDAPAPLLNHRWFQRACLMPDPPPPHGGPGFATSITCAQPG
jgi:hypothetical protein